MFKLEKRKTTAANATSVPACTCREGSRGHREERCCPASSTPFLASRTGTTSSSARVNEARGVGEGVLGIVHRDAVLQTTSIYNRALFTAPFVKRRRVSGVEHKPGRRTSIRCYSRITHTILFGTVHGCSRKRTEVLRYCYNSSSFRRQTGTVYGLPSRGGGVKGPEKANVSISKDRATDEGRHAADNRNLTAGNNRKERDFVNSVANLSNLLRIERGLHWMQIQQCAT